MSVSNNQEQLSAYLTLPSEPTQVTWQILSLSNADVPGPNKELLLAVITLRPDDFDTISQTLKPRSDAVGMHESWIVDWLPEPIVNSLTPAELPGYKKIGLPAFQADSFLLRSAPFKQGFVVPIDATNQIVILLTSKG